MTVAGASAPVRIELLWCHHEGRTLERVGTPLFLPGQLASVPKIRDFDAEGLIVQIHRLQLFLGRHVPIGEVDQNVIKLQIAMHDID